MNNEANKNMVSRSFGVIKETVGNGVWAIRRYYKTLTFSVKDFLGSNFQKFTQTKIGKFLDRFLFRYIRAIFKSKILKGLLFLSPALILLAVFTFYPIINSFILAFYKDYNPVDNTMNGWTFENFITVIKRPGFKDALVNTGLIVFISVPVSVIIALFIAIMLNSIKKLRSLFQTIFFLPYVTNTIALGLVFSVMFHSQYGLINKMLDFIGLSPVHWADSKATYLSAMATLMIYIIWSALAFKILVFTAGLQNIDKQYYDAARVDGTSKWRTFRRITVPLLSPMIAYITITSLIGAFKTYTHVVSLYGEGGTTAGGKDMRTIVFYVYDYIMGGNALNEGYLSKGAAASLILFGIILIFTFIQLYVSKKKVHY